MKRFATIAALLLLAVTMSGCGSSQGDTPAAEIGVASAEEAWTPDINRNSPSAKAYKGDLIAAIERSDRIVVIEHSSSFDYVDEETGDTDRLPSVIYGTVVLNAAQRETFVTNIRQVPEDTSNWALACVFDVHHSFFFYSKAALTSRMDVCFHCGEVKWDGTRHTPPLTLTEALAKVVKSAGLSPEREWVKVLAASRAASSAK